MTFHKPLNVIHWEHHSPSVDLNSLGKMDVIFGSNALRNNESKEVVGLRFRWTFRFASPKESLVSFIAEQDFIFEGNYARTEKEVWGFIQGSHMYYREEFDKRKTQAGITMDLTPVKKEDIDMKGVMDSMKD
jgi:hypothetical protein